MIMPPLAQQARWIPRARRWLAASAVLAGLGILAAYVLPRWTELVDVHTRHRAALRELADTQADLAALAPAMQSVAANPPASASFTSDPDGWIRRITDMSQAQRLHGITVQAGVPQEIGQVRRLPMVLNFDGDYLDAAAFLQNAERLPAAVRISTLHVRCTNLPTGQVEVQAGMNAYLPENP